MEKKETWLLKRNINYLFAFLSQLFVLLEYAISLNPFVELCYMYSIEKKITQTNAKIEKMERDMKTKEDLKTVALGTSKINYLDPRITVSWCKRHEVPIEKVNNFCHFR
jgi:hypothetical protein